ncbi:MAG: hypothetical protein M1820_005775 [Bogoriella megaspora]|nr:MAG: hypothetical protein M1820_005775 [Bogoriella megaspora]
MADSKPKTSSLDSTFPIDVPEDPALTLSDIDFDAHVRTSVKEAQRSQAAEKLEAATDALAIESNTDDASTAVGDDLGPASNASQSTTNVEPTGGAGGTPQQAQGFMDALRNADNTATTPSDMTGKMLTENADIAYSSTKSSAVDLFQELEKVISGARARELLETSWKDDPDTTLKIIWNARSIHLGKGERETFYRCLGWLAQQHPVTMISNLKWLHLSTIQKKAPKKDTADDEAVLIDAMEIDEDGMSESDKEWLIKYGGSHGYFKDLLNLLVLQVHGQLDVLGDPHSVLHVDNNAQKYKGKRNAARGSRNQKRAGCDQETARTKRHNTEAERHERFSKKFNDDATYRQLHLAVARLFAQQLKIDIKRLSAGDKASKSQITFAAKWAPSLEGFHDKHTFIASSIAEILFPRDVLFPNETDVPRTKYLKHAREAFRAKILSPLRAELAIVERDICSNQFSKINYSRVPSLAMNQYSGLFVKKDFDRFSAYMDKVAEGKSKISGAVLMPSILIKQARESKRSASGKDVAKRMLEEKMAEINKKVVDGQWKALVERIRESGELQSAIAVADVSGSMTGPRFADGTCPMDTSIGLSLLLAEVTKPPFGGGFITFSQDPHVQTVGGPEDTRTLVEKVDYIESSPWGMNTDFVAVFEELILPIAVKNKLPAEDMVKTVFVFSDMQFDAAESYSSTWDKSSFERIQKLYKEAGYEMPQLVFWNLAGGRAGHIAGYGTRYGFGDPRAPKPVDAQELGVALVSGYSQAQLKMFMEKGAFEDEEEQVEDEVVEGGDDDDMEVVNVVKKKQKMDPESMVMKAVSHRAYQMLKVLD